MVINVSLKHMRRISVWSICGQLLAMDANGTTINPAYQLTAEHTGILAGPFTKIGEFHEETNFW